MLFHGIHLETSEDFDSLNVPPILAKVGKASGRTLYLQSKKNYYGKVQN